MFQRYHISGSELPKSVQGVLNGAIQVCRVLSQCMNQEINDGQLGNGVHESNDQGSDKASIAVNITKCTIENLCEMGALAANDGGNLVAVLNVSWKGVVSLLQLHKGALAAIVKIPDIILKLISLASESVKCAAKAWSGISEDGVSVTEARKTFLPVKFYLINAARISSQYPNQAVLIYKEITLCVLMISTFRICLSRESFTVTASEVLTELLEQTSLDLINSLFNSSLLKQEIKCEILDWLFPSAFGPSPVNGFSPGIHDVLLMEDSLKCESETKYFLLGRLILFLELLKCSQITEEGRLEISRKLASLLGTLLDEEIYTSLLVLRIPTVNNLGTKAEMVWKSLYIYVLDALKISMILFYPNSGWENFLSFLLENIFHPHFLVWEIVLELWRFMVRHAEVEFITDIISMLCMFYRSMACSDTNFSPSRGLRQMARAICMIISNELQADQVYEFVVEDDKSELSAVMFVPLLMEGFDLGMLSSDTKRKAKQKIMSDYIGYIECFDDTAAASVTSGLLGSPVLAISASLQSL